MAEWKPTEIFKRHLVFTWMSLGMVILALSIPVVIGIVKDSVLEEVGLFVLGLLVWSPCVLFWYSRCNGYLKHAEGMVFVEMNGRRENITRVVGQILKFRGYSYEMKTHLQDDVDKAMAPFYSVFHLKDHGIFIKVAKEGVWRGPVFIGPVQAKNKVILEGLMNDLVRIPTIVRSRKRRGTLYGYPYA